MPLAGMAAGASDTLQELLARAFAEKQAQEQMALRQQAETRAERESNAAQAQRELQNRTQAAQVRTSTLTPGPISEADATALSGTPYEGMVEQKQTLPSRRIDMGGVTQRADAGGESYSVLRPTTGQMKQAGEHEGQRRVVGLLQRGAPRNEVLSAMAESGQDISAQMLNNPEATAAANREAAAERAREANQTRILLGGLAASGRAETTGLRNQLLQSQIDTAKTKQDEKKAADAKALGSMRSYGDDMLSVIDRLYDAKTGRLKPAAAGVIGVVEGAIPAFAQMEGGQNALADLDRLQSMLDINILRDLKNQSRTGASGFGALSERELGVIESAGSTVRKRRQSEAAYAAELKRLRDAIMAGRVAAPVGSGDLQLDPSQHDALIDELLKGGK